MWALVMTELAREDSWLSAQNPARLKPDRWLSSGHPFARPSDLHGSDAPASFGVLPRRREKEGA